MKKLCDRRSHLFFYHFMKKQLFLEKESRQLLYYRYYGGLKRERLYQYYINILEVEELIGSLRGILYAFFQMTLSVAVHFFLVFIHTIGFLDKVAIDMVMHNKKRLLKGYQQYE